MTSTPSCWCSNDRTTRVIAGRRATAVAPAHSRSAAPDRPANHSAAPASTATVTATSSAQSHHSFWAFTCPRLGTFRIRPTSDGTQ